MTHHESVRLTVGEQSLDLGVEHATEGNNGINIAPLLKETSDVTYDPGFMNTANAKSAVTFIDGDQGILRYRGYAIEDLAEHSSFMEVAYLLIYGELPESKETLEAWETNILRHNMVHEDLKLFFNGFPRDAHPMPVLSSSVSGLSTFYPDSLDPHDPEQVHISTVRLLGKLPVFKRHLNAVSSFKLGWTWMILISITGVVLAYMLVTQITAYAADGYEGYPAVIIGTYGWGMIALLVVASIVLTLVRWPKKTIDDMNEAIADSVAEENLRNETKGV